MTRRRLLALVCFSTPILGVGVACSFPDVSYSPTSKAAETGADTGADAHASSEAGLDASDDSPVSELSDAAPVDLTACHTCDCDGDGYWRDAGCDAAATDAANRRGFGDCDDSRIDYHPDQSNYFVSVADGSTQGFDYNCDGRESPLYVISTTCSGLVLTGCTPGTEFFQTSVKCGQSGEKSSCVGGGFANATCTAATNGKSGVQPCQ